MRDDPIQTLERELVEAARRQARNGRRSRVRRAGSSFLTVALLVVTLVVAGGAFVLLRGTKQDTHPAAAVPGRAELIRILGVLRRPQTRADLHSREIVSFLMRVERGQGMPFLVAHGSIDIPLVRRAAVTPWGTGVFVIPLRPATSQSIAEVRQRFPSLPPRFFDQPRLRHESLMMYVDGGGCCASAQDIEQSGDLQWEGAGRTFAGGSTQTRLITLVPDGVAKVTFVLPRRSGHSLGVTASVHGNVAAVQVDLQWTGGQPAMIWYAANGRVSKRIGNFAPAAIRQPKPEPETAPSRAAERDPSTPNPVWVTPSTGGPHTNFKLHFRVLLTDADYSYRLSGTRCPAITVNGGSGGGTDDVRGQIWSDAVAAVAGQIWCPGTYHLSATVMDLGRHGMLKHPAKPFGTATFTVWP